jgi:hypothetical protein
MQIGRWSAKWVSPLLATSLLVMSAGADADEPQVGDIYDIKPGASFRGWALAENGRTSHPSAVFENGDRYFVASTDIISAERPGRAEVRKITALRQVRKQTGEEEVINVDCTLLAETPALSFFAKATGIARAFFIFPDEVREQRWFPNPDQPCEYGGD